MTLAGSAGIESAPGGGAVEVNITLDLSQNTGNELTALDSLVLFFEYIQV